MRSRPKVLVGVAVLLALVAGVGFAEYNRAKVQAVMQANQNSLFKLSSATNGSRYMEAAGYLLTISSGMYSIKDYTPPKGTKAEWDATFASLLKATWRGLAACADENQANLKAAVAEINKLMNDGHETFR